MTLYLNGLPDVLQTAADGDQEPVESDHLLHQDSVHGLLVVGGVLPQGGLLVKVRRQLAQDVRRHLVHHLVRRLAAAAATAGLGLERKV